MPLRRFRFACRATGRPERTRREWERLALTAEALGYDTFAVADHFGTRYAPLLVLQLVAACTSRIRLATLVLDNDFRHPAVLAKEAATLDLLSEGRLELGLGAGWLPEDYERSGIPFEDGATRVSRLEEAVGVLKLLFGEAPATFSGRHYALRDLAGTPRPAQRPHPPILVGGSGRRLLRLAAREADIVSLDSGAAGEDPSGWTLDALVARAALVREAAGGREPELHLNPDVWEVTDDRRAAVDSLAARLGLDPEGLDRSAYVLAGRAEQIAEHLLRLREAAGITYVTVPSDRMEAFVPVLALLRGA